MNSAEDGMTGFVRACLLGGLSLGLMSCQSAAPPVETANVPAPVVRAEVKAPAPEVQQVAAPAAHPGEAVYKQACAMCHDNPEGTRAPAKDTLKQMGLQFISYALTQGKMKDIGATLTADQRGQ
ncbi:MAG: cytochrome c, partial [Sphingomonadales bacterium]